MSMPLELVVQLLYSVFSVVLYDNRRVLLTLFSFSLQFGTSMTDERTTTWSYIQHTHTDTRDKLHIPGAGGGRAGSRSHWRVPLNTRALFLIDNTINTN